MSDTFHKKIKFSEPGTYRLEVQGKVHPEVWNHFEGKTYGETMDSEGHITTTLNLHVRDQAELSGFINMIHDWRLVLLSIRLA